MSNQIKTGPGGPLDSRSVDDDKFPVYESSDSGYKSGENLTSSCEIKSEELSVEGDHKQDLDFMRLDSGVDLGLSESLSGLHIKTPDLNDLSKPKGITQLSSSSTSATTITASIPTPPVEPQDYFQQDEDGDTLLHSAIVHRFCNVVLALIRIAPHPFLLDTPNDFAESPIHLAAATGQWRMVRWLIVAGAKPSPRNGNGDSPLHIAARNGDTDCCRAIMEPVKEQERALLACSYPQQPHNKPNMDQWNHEGQTCVHVAAMYGHIDVLRYLIWNGADLNAKEGRGGYTALHYSVERGDERLTHYLLTECKQLDPEALTYGGCSALQIRSDIPPAIQAALRSRGVPSPYSSDEEYSDSESESEFTYENTKFMPNFVHVATA